MNYGQAQTQSDTPQDFFTVGAGTNSEDLNNVNPEDNLDLSNDQVSWGTDFMQMPPDNITEPIRNIDTPPIPEAIPESNPAEASQSAINTNGAARQGIPSLEAIRNTPELGQITPGEPQTDNSLTNPSTPSQKAQQYLGIPNLDTVKTVEKLNNQEISAIEGVINKLGQDIDAADFYEIFRGGTH